MADFGESDERKAKISGSAGGALVGLGAGAYGLGTLSKKLAKAENDVKLVKDLKKLAEEKPEEFAKSVKNLKRAGGAIMAVGTPLVGYSVYKHYKNKKKKDDNKKKD